MAIVDPCDLPAAEQLQDVRSSVFRTEFKAALNAFLEQNNNPCGIDCDQSRSSWNEQHPEEIPYGQSLLIAAAETAGLDGPRYRSDRKRDIALSRQAGIDAALNFSGADALMPPWARLPSVPAKRARRSLQFRSGHDTTGLPFGVTLFTSLGADAALLEVGAAVAAITGQRIMPQAVRLFGGQLGCYVHLTRAMLP